MITQNDIFVLYSKMANGSSYKNTGWFNIEELATLYEDEEVIEMIVAMMGSSHINWDYGHWRKFRDHLISTYGEKLVPILERRIADPLHGGGTAYGKVYLSRSRQYARAFCRSTLDRLRGGSGDVSQQELPVYKVAHKQSGVVLKTFDRHIDAINFQLFGRVDIPEKVTDEMLNWHSFDYEIL